MEVTVRPIAEADIEGFRAAVDAVARERRYLAGFEAESQDVVTAFVRSNIEQAYPQYVASADGHIVGWCDVTPEGRPLYAHVGILGMGVLAEHRGQGIGRRLLRACLAAARRRGFRRIELQVRAPNTAAIALYLSEGFEREGLKRRAACVDGLYEDVVCMGLLLDD